MAKKYSRSQYKKERNANKDTRPKATLRNARVSTTKAAFVLDAIRGKDVETALGILLYNPRYASTFIEKLLNLQSLMQKTITEWTQKTFTLQNVMQIKDLQ